MLFLSPYGRVLNIKNPFHEVPRSSGRVIFVLEPKRGPEFSGPLAKFKSTQIYLPQSLAFRFKWFNCKSFECKGDMEQT